MAQAEEVHWIATRHAALESGELDRNRQESKDWVIAAYKGFVTRGLITPEIAEQAKKEVSAQKERKAERRAQAGKAKII